MTIPTLETERLFLRPLDISDADEAFKNWTSDSEVAKYMSWNAHKSVEDTKEWLKLTAEEYKTKKCFNFAIVLKENNMLIGSGGIMFSDEKGMYEIGYCLMKEHWRKGIAAEAMKRVLDFAVSELSEHRFLGRHAVLNPASGKVLEKLGFKYVKDCIAEFPSGKAYKTKEYLLEL